MQLVQCEVDIAIGNSTVIQAYMQQVYNSQHKNSECEAKSEILIRNKRKFYSIDRQIFINQVLKNISFVPLFVRRTAVV